jgi:predicted HicB family RNase H-like nuclease
MTQPKRPRGRPPVKDPASVRINVRVTPAEREAYKAKAQKAKAPSLSAWLKGLADRE